MKRQALIFALSITVVSGCGTLELGIEPATTEHIVQTPPVETSAPTPTDTLTATPTITPLPTPVQSTTHQPGAQGNDHSSSPCISADGRHVVFSSSADNLVEGDTNQVADVFVHDRQTHTTELVSLASDGTQANETSSQPCISADGRWIVFVSLASNLAARDTNDMPDVFVHDRNTGATTLVSAVIDGRAGNGMSMEPKISADGRWIAFSSSADDLVPEVDAYTGADTADTNGTTDIFVYDRQGGSIWRVSLSSNGEQANGASDLPGISSDGRWVVFWSAADNLVPGHGTGIYLHDRSAGSTVWIVDGFAPTISPDGRWIGYLSVSSDTSSDDGGYYATLYDRQTNEVTVIGAYAREIHGRPSNAISFSTDAEWLAFASTLAFPANPTSSEGEWGQQIFLRDSSLGALTPISISPDGLLGNSYSALAHLSSDGHWVAFQSFADNLVPEDTNGFMDIFVWDRELVTIELVSVATGP